MKKKEKLEKRKGRRNRLARGQIRKATHEFLSARQVSFRFFSSSISTHSHRSFRNEESNWVSKDARKRMQGRIRMRFVHLVSVHFELPSRCVHTNVISCLQLESEDKERERIEREKEEAKIMEMKKEMLEKEEKEAERKVEERKERLIRRWKLREIERIAEVEKETEKQKEIDRLKEELRKEEERWESSLHFELPNHSHNLVIDKIKIAK